MAEDKKTLDTAMKEIQDIIVKMGAEDCSLEKSFELYSEGVQLLKFCNDSIDKVEKDIIVLEEQQ